MNDDGLRIAHFMQFLGFFPLRHRMVERSDFGRLLPDCCPTLLKLCRTSATSSGERTLAQPSLLLPVPWMCRQLKGLLEHWPDGRLSAAGKVVLRVRVIDAARIRLVP